MSNILVGLCIELLVRWVAEWGVGDKYAREEGFLGALKLFLNTGVVRLAKHIPVGGWGC